MARWQFAAVIAAGLVAKKANALGLTVAPYVKTSLAPGSRVVTDYFERDQSGEGATAEGAEAPVEVEEGAEVHEGNPNPCVLWHPRLLLSKSRLVTFSLL